MADFRLLVSAGGWHWPVCTEAAIPISIDQSFGPDQPNHFGAPRAASVAWESGGFVGDTTRGGSCNVAAVSLVPHCNGTHTETASHIIRDLHPVGARLLAGPVLARLVSVTPVAAESCGEDYLPPWLPGDRVITASSLQAALEQSARVPEQLPRPAAWVIRTLPNPETKKSEQYSFDAPPPFLTSAAIRWLLERGAEHLLVDLPSIDRMADEGRMTNHCLFWEVDPADRQPGNGLALQRTVTEMVFVPDSAADGIYLLDLQVPAWQSDAAPSRPVLFPLDLG